ncbi:GMP synthase [Strigomonas culicis]|uniref:GMP synthase (glutamine-hydrolyzing) n=1 Tax=Strigomonas culicis TaxID=28005 RepID=S9UVU3_9TRYP|nr:GMP synthase [Strigomonas culicis]|eukprot:EPY18616.1 GMP synthase [Strigomonas culicis]
MASQSTHEYVAILDAGSQFGKVIDRRVRELQVETQILPLDTPVAVLKQDPNLKGVIISGGPSSVTEKGAPQLCEGFFDLGKPILGICYGMQLLAVAYGANVKGGATREDGQDDVTLKPDVELFAGLATQEPVLLTHNDSVTDVAAPLDVIATSSLGIVAGIRHTSLPYYGLQFHPEVELTVHGKVIFKNFLTICGCSFSFTMEDREEVALRLIKERTANDQKVLCLASGGVDSTICAVLLLKALGPERVVCIHIDHGFMRLDESRQVIAALKDAGVHVHLINAADDFAQATTEMPAKGGRAAYQTKKLCETTDPEEKRTIIGNTFMAICDKTIKELHLDVDNLLLAQGTAAAGSHRVGVRPTPVRWQTPSRHTTTTPLSCASCATRARSSNRSATTTRTRCASSASGSASPHTWSSASPSPARGLAIRTLCTDGTPHRDTNFERTEETVKKTISERAPALVAQGVTSCLLPIRTVGVQGDGRTYAYAAAVALGRLPLAEEWQALMRLAKDIPKSSHAINRVVYAFGAPLKESPQTVTKTLLCPAVMDQLREADDIVNRTLQKHHLVRALSQVPVVLIPVGFEKASSYSVVVRTFLTNDFMTGVPATPGSEYMPLPFCKR